MTKTVFKFILALLALVGALVIANSIYPYEPVKAAITPAGSVNSSTAILLNSSTYNIAGDTTIIAHVYITGFTSDTSLHDLYSKISFSPASGIDFWYQDTTSAGNGFDLGMRVNGNQSTFELSTTTIKQNTWYCVAAVYDAGVDQWIYFRNMNSPTLISRNKGSATSTIATNTNIARWGNRADGNNEAFLGRIDNARIYSTALSSDQINVLCNQRSGRNEFPQVLSAYRFDYYIGSNTVYPDYNQQRNGTVSGTLLSYDDGPPVP